MACVASTLARAFRDRVRFSGDCAFTTPGLDEQECKNTTKCFNIKESNASKTNGILSFAEDLPLGIVFKPLQDQPCEVSLAPPCFWSLVEPAVHTKEGWRKLFVVWAFVVAATVLLEIQCQALEGTLQATVQEFNAYTYSTGNEILSDSKMYVMKQVELPE